MLTRTLAKPLAIDLGQSIIVENIAGGGGNIAVIVPRSGLLDSFFSSTVDFMRMVSPCLTGQANAIYQFVPGPVVCRR